jgi:hypothetical protein
MSQELMYLEQIFGRGGNWLSVTILAGLLIAVIFRPNTIYRPTLFRVACWLLAVSVAVTPLLNLFLSVISFTAGGRGMGFGSPGSEFQFFMACGQVVGPLLQGGSIICGLTSLLPPLRPRPPFDGPAKHPME